MQEGRHGRRRRPRRRPLSGRGGGGLPQLPREHRRSTAPRIAEVYTKGTLTLARLGREAPIAAANPAGAGAAQRRGRQPRGAPALPRVRQTSPEKLPRSPVIGTDAPVQYEQRDDIGAPQAAAARTAGTARRRRQYACSRADRRERSTRCRPLRHSSTSARPASRARSRRSQRLGPEARVIAGGHSLLPMMKLRLANPEHLIDINDLARARLHPRGGRRDPDRRAHPPRRPAEVRPAGRALPAVPRRRAGDRRPGRAQPRHDRRLALPGRRGRGPLGRLHRRQGAGRDPRRRRRARRRHGRLPRRPVHDRGRRRRDAHRGAAAAPPRRRQRAREGRAPRRRLGDRRRVGRGLDRRRHDRRRRHRAQRGRPDDDPPHARRGAAARPGAVGGAVRAGRRDRLRGLLADADGRGPVDYKRHLAGVLTQRALRRATARALHQEA